MMLREGGSAVRLGRSKGGLSLEVGVDALQSDNGSGHLS